MAISTMPCAWSARSARPRPISIVNSINPHRIEGQKTASFEIIEELGDAPDIHILPVGNAGNITAYWKRLPGISRERPRLQAAKDAWFPGCRSAPIYYDKIIPNPETVASAIRIGNPGKLAIGGHRHPGIDGAIDIVTDLEILEAQRWLASREGIFVEPASAASIAGLLKCLCAERCPTCPLPAMPEGARIVCTVTGHGLKDPDIAREQCGRIIPAKAEKAEIMRTIAAF